MNFDDIRDRLPEFSPLQVRALLMLGGVGLLLSTLFFLLSRGHTEEITQPLDRKSTRLNSSHSQQSRMPSSA